MIDEARIIDTIKKAGMAHEKRVYEIFDKAKELNGLDIEEAAVLLNITEPDQLEELFETALNIKEEIYGRRLVLFAPLYCSNYCVNNCLYCGFRADNKQLQRKALTLEEIKAETLEILRQGHKRILMLMGENHRKSSLDYFISAIEATYSVKDEHGSSIRRINVEIAPLDNDGLKELSKANIGTYTVFQETYHRATYQKMHPHGPKSDYDYRITTMDRALTNGLHDVGIGALFGLYDFRFEVLALLEHSEYLLKKYGTGPHTISIPRIKPAQNAPASENLKYAVSDIDFKKLIAVLRMSVPYTGMILSTREPSWLRSEIFELGVSQISAGSRTTPGGYKQALDIISDDGQFNLNDCRTSGEVIADVIQKGYVPSFCTACYRLGRVGSDFMDLARPGLIKLHCQPNGLLTLMEYLMDYADETTKKAGEKLIDIELAQIPKKNVREKTKKWLDDIKNGKRDLYF